jgi:hypothetical protein
MEASPAWLSTAATLAACSPPLQPFLHLLVEAFNPVHTRHTPAHTNNTPLPTNCTHTAQNLTHPTPLHPTTQTMHSNCSIGQSSAPQATAGTCYPGLLQRGQHTHGSHNSCKSKTVNSQSLRAVQDQQHAHPPHLAPLLHLTLKGRTIHTHNQPCCGWLGAEHLPSTASTDRISRTVCKQARAHPASPIGTPPSPPATASSLPTTPPSPPTTPHTLEPPAGRLKSHPATHERLAAQ